MGVFRMRRRPNPANLSPRQLTILSLFFGIHPFALMLDRTRDLLYNCIYKYTKSYVHTMSKILDKHSPIPLYHQLANWIEARIADGTFQVGEKIPSETRLPARFPLNR